MYINIIIIIIIIISSSSSSIRLCAQLLGALDRPSGPWSAPPVSYYFYYCYYY